MQINNKISIIPEAKKKALNKPCPNADVIVGIP